LVIFHQSTLLDLSVNIPREAELEQDNEIFIGPPPPAIVTEVASANEAERFEEVLNINPCLSLPYILCFLILSFIP